MFSYLKNGTPCILGFRFQNRTPADTGTHLYLLAYPRSDLPWLLQNRKGVISTLIIVSWIPEEVLNNVLRLLLWQIVLFFESAQWQLWSIVYSFILNYDTANGWDKWAWNGNMEIATRLHIEETHMLEPALDWANCRSPGNAAVFDDGHLDFLSVHVSVAACKANSTCPEHILTGLWFFKKLKASSLLVGRGGIGIVGSGPG